MRTLTFVLSIALSIVAVTASGVTFVGHALKSYNAAPAAIIGIASCGKFIGAVGVTHGGDTVALPGLPADQAQTIAKQLGAGHNMLVNVPCSGQST